jgi:hypothetical protein
MVNIDVCQMPRWSTRAPHIRTYQLTAQFQPGYVKKSITLCGKNHTIWRFRRISFAAYASNYC